MTAPSLEVRPFVGPQGEVISSAWCSACVDGFSSFDLRAVLKWAAEHESSESYGLILRAVSDD